MKVRFNYMIMKKLFIVAAIALLGGVMTACSSSDEPDNSLVVWDATPVQFYIQIENEAGVDLLDSTKHETFMKDIFVKMGDETYSIEPESTAGTRYYLPTFKGLVLREYYSNKTFTYPGDWCLVFGEFDGAKSGSTLISFHAGNAMVNLSCTNEVSPSSKGVPHISRKYYVNNEQVTDEAGNLGRYHFVYTSKGDLEYVPSEYE